jgi:hypothetical protein
MPKVSVSMSDVDLDASETKNHPNAMPFTGTLLLVDQPSDQPPHGSDGHLIQVSKQVAEERLKTLPGMAVNVSGTLEGHDPQNKIGVIRDAWLDGDKVKVKGLVWKKDFPEAARKLKMNKNRLGMSMELGDVYVKDKDDDVWDLQDFHFTGATILLKDHAAYESTELAASKHFINAMAAARDASYTLAKKNGGLRKVIEQGAERGVRKALKKV